MHVMADVFPWYLSIVDGWLCESGKEKGEEMNRYADVGCCCYLYCTVFDEAK